jgi:hypothetical protein
MKQPIKSMIVSAASAALILASSASLAAGMSCTNDGWNKVMKRGKMVVGVKADYKPWGYRSTSGAIVGMEADMAKIAADAMGVELDLVAVQSSNRMQFLENGKIDLMIATMSDRADRRKLVGITQPNYYTSGTNIMSPKGVGIKKWEDLRGKPVCGKQGAFYNKVVTDRYGAKVVALPVMPKPSRPCVIKNVSPGYTTILQSCRTCPRVTTILMKCRSTAKTITPGVSRCHWLKRTVSSATSCPDSPITCTSRAS